MPGCAPHHKCDEEVSIIENDRCSIARLNTNQHAGENVENRNVELFKRLGAGLAITVFPIMLLFGFVLHPDIFSFQRITTAAEWATEWRGNFFFHFGHLLVLFVVPLSIVMSVRFMSLLQRQGVWYGFVGCMLSVFGAFMLAVDKGALTLVLTAFQTLPEEQFANIFPALQTLLDKAGWLWITWLFAILPIGVILQTIGLIKEDFIPAWQGLVIIVGLALLLNPDIEIISVAGSALMCVGIIPIGIRELRGPLERAKDRSA